MTISELNECLGRMRKIYSFNDDKTSVRLEKNPVKGNLNVEVSTYDDDNDVEITLSACKRTWILDGSNH